MNTLFTILLLIMCYAPLYVILGLMPYMTRKTESFGISIPEETFSDPEIAGLRGSYRNSVLIYGGLIILAAFLSGLLLPVKTMPVTLLMGMVLFFAVVSVFYIIHHHKMKRLKQKKGWMSGKVQVVVANITPGAETSPLWFILYAIVIALTVLIGVTYYDHMPERVPIHYDLNGNINGWAQRSPKMILFAPSTQLFLSVIMVFVYMVIRKAKQQIDASKPEESLERIRIFRKAWSAFTVFGGLALLLLFGFMQLSFIGLVTNPSVILITPLSVAGLFIIAAIVLSVKVGQGGSRLALKTGMGKADAAISRDDDTYWKLGVFYFNPDDPALFLEKRFGIGWTCNFARPMAWILILGVIGLIIASVILSFILTGGRG